MLAIRIHIIGGSGSGKSYIAALLSDKLRIPHYDLDVIFWDHQSNEYGVRHRRMSVTAGSESIYPRDLEDVSRQVPHSAPTNTDGYKPVYIDMWTKLSKSWDIDEIKTSVRIIAKDFLGLNIGNVELIDTPTYEETRLSYEHDYKPFVNEN
ncbi:hypothetical protein [Paenibacillus ginsengarvi]|uniref:DNA topology modulation protein FlaR n=1 Tax=Paenibacillus ginsengarvi TaxID=400777 RepID=A0A3B0AHK7_9BACL|nr:hypothetical protein [Paenibacillus ginsengarvi]RKN60048.1 hypothetical protein D7M11_35935 [Paenibacillus ginsengarvi]